MTILRHQQAIQGEAILCLPGLAFRPDIAPGPGNQQRFSSINNPGNLFLPEHIRRFFALFFFAACITILLVACQSGAGRQLSPQQQLFDAARNGEAEHILRLLENGVDANSQSADGGISALLLASENDDQATVANLLIYGADANFSSTKGGFSPLIRASIRGHVSVVKILLKAGASINYQSSVGGTALMWATLRKRHGVMRVLLAADAAVDARGVRGESALFFAVDNDDKVAAALLLGKDADPYLPDMLGKTPADHATDSGRLEILQLIKQQQQQLQLRSI